MGETKTPALSPAVIASIAEELDKGLTVYVPIAGETEMLFLPCQQNLDYAEEGTYAQDLEVLRADPSAYFEIEPPSSKEQYLWMQKFASSQSSSRSQDLLLDSLSGRQPFKRFRDTLIDLELQSAWNAFTRARYTAHVEHVLGQFPSIEHPWLRDYDWSDDSEE